MTRRAVVLAALVLAAVVAACTAPAWVRATTSSPSVAQVPLAVTGTALAPGVGAGALVVAASALALALGRRWGQRLALLGIAIGGLLVTAASLGAAAGAEAAALSAARDAVGVGTLTGAPALGPWPWLVAGLGALVLALAVAGGLAARRWARPTRRFDPAGQQAAARSRPAPAPDAPADAPADAPDGTPDGRTVDADVWDALSRGEDPT